MNQKSTLYTCPMHPEIEQSSPGFCPICGMDLEPRVVRAEQDDTEFLAMNRRFWIGAVLTIPILFLGDRGWLQFLFATPVVLWAGWPFFERAALSVARRSPNMFTLIALGVGSAYFYSVFALFFPSFFPAEALFLYFEPAAVITVLVLLGQVIELRARLQATRSMKALLSRAAKSAHLILGEEEKEIPIEQVHKGNLLRVKPGEKVPVDGQIVEGSSYIDESMITGESEPIPKSAGDSIVGGSINQTGSFIMEAKKVGHETLLARIIQMVAEAQRSRAPIQHVVDRISSYFVPAVLLISCLTFLLWILFGPSPQFAYAFLNAIAVLIIACPCALGLATPMSIMVGVGKGAEVGVLIKNAEALEKLEKVNTLVLDKTGTLTEGKPRVTTLLTHRDENEILRLAAAVERESEHPFAHAILHEAEKRNLKIPKCTDFQSTPGFGVKGIVEGKKVEVSKAGSLRKEFQKEVNKAQESAKTTIFVSIDGEVQGCFFIEDPIKKETSGAIEELHRMGIQLMMLTGDRELTAKAVAKELHMDQVYAEIGPEKKAEMIRSLKQQNQRVAMAGDGVNDAVALSLADVGIAMGTGTDVAIESAGVTLVKGDLRGIVRAIHLSRETMQNIRQNLFFAFIYNILGIPIAAGLFYPIFGLLLNPMLASLAMALSSISVILNSLRIRIK